MKLSLPVRLLLFLVFGCIAFGTLDYFEMSRGVHIEDSSRRSSPINSMRGTDHKPFVYRQFVPLMLRGVAAVVPESVRESIDRRLRDGSRKSGHINTWWERGYALEYLVYFASAFLCILVTMYVWAHSANLVYQCNALVSHISAACMGLMVPIFFFHSKFYYDPFTLLFASVGLLLIFSRRIGLFYPVLALAALNKETAILLVPAWLIVNHHWKMPRRELVIHGIVQAVMVGGIVLALRIRFAANPGTPMEFHLLDHNLPYQSLSRKMPILSFVVPVGLLLALSCRQHLAPLVVRRIFVLTAVALFALTLWGGCVEELRDYLEVLPVASLLLTPVLHLLILGRTCAIRDEFADNARSTEASSTSPA